MQELWNHNLQLWSMLVEQKLILQTARLEQLADTSQKYIQYTKYTIILIKCYQWKKKMHSSTYWPENKTYFIIADSWLNGNKSFTWTGPSRTLTVSFMDIDLFWWSTAVNILSTTPFLISCFLTVTADPSGPPFKIYEKTNHS